MIQGVSDKVNKMVQSILSDQGKAAQSNNAAAQSAKPNVGSQGDKQPPLTVDSQVVQDAVNRINEVSTRVDAKLSLAIDQELNRVLIRFTDPTSGEVVRQIPPEAVLKMMKRLDDLKGAMFDGQG